MPTVGNVSGTIPRDAKRKMMVAVFEVTEKLPKPQRHITAMGSSQGARIRVCTGRLTAACNPGVCDCPDYECKVRMSKVQMLVKLIKFAIFGFAVEEAVRFGIWSDASKTDLLTKRYLAWANEFFQTRNKTQRTPNEKYEMRRITYNWKNVWNNIVIWANDAIASVPSMISGAFNHFLPTPPTKIELPPMKEDCFEPGVQYED